MKTLTMSQKYHLLTIPKGQLKEKTFPTQYLANGSFRLEWLSQHPWMMYSERVDGVFCTACAIFCSDASKSKFVTKPFRKWNKKSEKVKEGPFKAKKNPPRQKPAYGPGRMLHLDQKAAKCTTPTCKRFCGKFSLFIATKSFKTRFWAKFPVAKGLINVVSAVIFSGKEKKKGKVKAFIARDGAVVRALASH